MHRPPTVLDIIRNSRARAKAQPTVETVQLSECDSARRIDRRQCPEATCKICTESPKAKLSVPFTNRPQIRSNLELHIAIYRYNGRQRVRPALIAKSELSLSICGPDGIYLLLCVFISIPGHTREEARAIRADISWFLHDRQHGFAIFIRG